MSQIPSSDTPRLRTKAGTDLLHALVAMTGARDQAAYFEQVAAIEEEASRSSPAPAGPLREALESIRARHVPNEWDSCVTCRQQYPCEDELAAYAALASPPAPAGLQKAAEDALTAHAIDHIELDAYRQKDSLETGECRACDALRAALASSPAPAELDVLPCGYQFAGPGAGRCMQFPDHAIHHGAWLHREENHDYVAGPDRRKGERRASSPAPAGLDDHTQEADSNGVWCREDGQRWPCDTIRAATRPAEDPK